MSTSYRKWLLEGGMRLPPWLLGKWGSRWVYMIGLVNDAIMEATVQAVKARFPTVAPDDALPYLAEDRMLEPGLGEDSATLRKRILGVWDAWQWAGTEKGLLDQLKAWLPSADWRVIANREWSVPPEGRPASPDYDPGHGKPGDPDYRPPRGKCAIDGADWWSRMWVLLQQPHPWKPWKLGDPPLGDGILLGDGSVTIGSTALPHHAEACARIVRLWKAGHEYVPHVIVNLDTVILGTDVPLGTFNLGGSAAYWPVS